MATSSLEKDFVIKSETETSNLANLLQESLNKPYEFPKVNYKILTTDEIETFLFKTKLLP